jgi:hypothetical protein
MKMPTFVSKAEFYCAFGTGDCDVFFISRAIEPIIHKLLDIALPL